MHRRHEDNINSVGRGNKASRSVLYVICILIILITILLDVYFILGIVS